MRAKEIESKIRGYAQSYYEGHPQIPDEEFNKLVEELRLIKPHSKILTTPRWGYKVKGLRTRYHNFPLKSIEKRIKIVEERDQLEKLSLTNFWASPKLDGAGAVAYYKNNELQYILSLGDSTGKAKDITRNIITVPQKIKSNSYISNYRTGDFSVRGEIVVPLNKFDKEIYSSPRNMACGLSQKKECDENEKKSLYFVAHSISTCDITCYENETKNKFPSYQNSLLFLYANNFWTVPTLYYATISELLEDIDSNELTPTKFNYVVKENKIMKNILVDGIVLTKEDYHVSTFLSNTNIFEIQAIALKYKSPTAISKVKRVTYNVSRTGRLVPLVEIEPVFLSGAKIQKITGNNYSWIRERGIGIDAEVEVTRANEVIPSIIGVRKKAKLILKPIRCPECNSRLVMKGLDLVCENQNCPVKVRQNVIEIFNICKEKGLGKTIIESIITKFNLTTSNILNFNPDIKTLIQTFGPAKAKIISKTLTNIKTRNYKISEIIKISNIPFLGSHVQEALDKNISLEKWTKACDKKKPPQEWIRYFVSKTSWTNFNKYFDKISELTKILIQK